MKFLNSKKSEMFLALLFGLIIVLFFIGWLVNIGSRECRTNSDCGSDFYCGSDFSCHQIPVVEKTIVKNNLIVPSLIIGIAIIIAAIVLKWRKMPFRNRNGPEEEEHKKNNLIKTL